MGRGLIERAGLGPRASLSAAVASTGPQAGASWSMHAAPKLRRNCRTPREKLSQQVKCLRKSKAERPRVHVAACEPHWATAIYAPGDGESSQLTLRKGPREWRRLALEHRGSGCGRPVGRPLPGSAVLPGAARRAPRRHRSRAGGNAHWTLMFVENSSCSSSAERCSLEAGVSCPR